MAGKKKHFADYIQPSEEFLLHKKGTTHLNHYGDRLFVCLSFLQEYDNEVTNGKDERVIFPSRQDQQRNEKQPLTSDVFSCEGQRWRAVLTEDSRLYIQLISSAHPVTAEIK